MFDEKSRYKNVVQETMQDRRGRTVKIVIAPEAPRQIILGHHQRIEGQRVDHLAFKYLNNVAGFWRIAEANSVMLPETLSEQSEITIPNK